MQTFRNVTRRSFLTRVAGGGLIAGAGLIVGAKDGAAQQKTEPETRQMVVDADPGDPARPPRVARRSGVTDSDSGPRSDAPGQGAHGSSNNAAGPPERFVVCPGNPRCPR